MLKARFKITKNRIENMGAKRVSSGADNVADNKYEVKYDCSTWKQTDANNIAIIRITVFFSKLIV